VADRDPHRIPQLTGLAQARRFLLDYRPDLLHSHGFHANVFGRLLRLLVPRPVVLSTIHNVYEGGSTRMFAYRLTDQLSRRTVAVSDAAARRFIELKAVPQDGCSVLPNGIDIEEFAPNPERRAHVRAEMGVPAADGGPGFVWLAAGRITPAKDYPNLLRGFRRARSEFLDAELWIAGAPADATAKRSANGVSQCLSSIAVEHGCQEHVRWLGLRRDMPALLDAADAFVQASAWEGMPLAVGEAMAMEKPVVATDAGGVRELMGDAGVLVPSRNSEALAEAMIAMMRRSREERAQLGHSARELIARSFNMNQTADAWEALYGQLLR
jgi:glycosyltransferase involved in cell wall biosynthesis